MRFSGGPLSGRSLPKSRGRYPAGFAPGGRSLPAEEVRRVQASGSGGIYVASRSLPDAREYVWLPTLTPWVRPVGDPVIRQWLNTWFAPNGSISPRRAMDSWAHWSAHARLQDAGCTGMMDMVTGPILDALVGSGGLGRLLTAAGVARQDGYYVMRPVNPRCPARPEAPYLRARG